jgi:hypothetical protein
MRRLSALCVLCAVVLLGGCDIPGGKDWVERPVAGPLLVVDYNLQSYIPIPVAGKRPVWSLTRSDLTIEKVAWEKRDVGGRFQPLPQDPAFTFAADGVYRAAFTLTAQGYYFNPDIPFSYDPDLIEAQDSPDLDATQRRVSVTYKQTSPAMVVPKYDLQDYVPVPVAGPARLSYTREDLKVSVEWWQDTKGGFEFSPVPEGFSAFTANCRYKAVITLTAQGLFLFNEEIPFAYKDGTTIERYDIPDAAGTKDAAELTEQERVNLRESRTITVIYRRTQKS